MDRMPPEMLTLVCNHLPWKERLAIRGVSPMFSHLRSDPVQLTICRMEQKERSFIFGLSIESTKEQKVIEIVKDQQEKDFTITKAEVYTGRNYQTCHKTMIRCCLKEYHRFVQLYMKYLLSPLFIIDRLRLINLKNESLVRLLEIQGVLGRKEANLRLELYSKNIKISKEERNLLELYKGLNRFKYCPPARFHPPADFWFIPLIRNADELTLQFGGRIGHSSLDSNTVETNLSINDSFIGWLIARERKKFVSNTISTVTPEYLMHYIQNCLLGNHTMLCLQVHHQFRSQDLALFRAFLRMDRFEEYKRDRWIVRRNGEPKEGFDPDQLVVQIYPDAIRIVGDFGSYRGKKANVNPARPLTTPVQETRSFLLNLMVLLGPVGICMVNLSVCILLLLIVALHVSSSADTPEDHGRMLIRLVESNR